MGCGQSSDQMTSDEKRRNQMIEDTLKRDKAEMRNTVKMLMLGAGESGKSTMVKQMRLLYADTYANDERESYREVVYSNALQSMQAVIRGFEIVEVAFPEALVTQAEFLLSLENDATESGSHDMDPHIVSAITAIWKETVTKEVVGKSAAFQLNDSASYFFDEIKRIGGKGYIPTDQDILRTRVRSTGITEEKFFVRGYTLRVFDVGGQRSERKKWIHCFENVQVLVFVAAINEYDQTLWEDENINRMDEATMLFESIASSRWFEKSAFVLLLNKTDLFEAKLPVSPLGRVYSDFSGASVEDAKQYLLRKFTDLDKQGHRRPLYTHFTCATDTSQVSIVMGAVMDSVLSALLSEVGLM